MYEILFNNSSLYANYFKNSSCISRTGLHSLKFHFGCRDIKKRSPKNAIHIGSIFKQSKQNNIFR